MTTAMRKKKNGKNLVDLKLVLEGKKPLFEAPLRKAGRFTELSFNEIIEKRIQWLDVCVMYITGNFRSLSVLFNEYALLRTSE